MAVEVTLLIVLLQGVREQGAEEDIWAEEEAHNRTLEQITLWFVLRNKYYADDKINDRNAGYVARKGD